MLSRRQLLTSLQSAVAAPMVARFVLSIVAILLAGLFNAAPMAANTLPRTILVIDQFEQASAGSVAVLSGFRSTAKSSPAPVSVHIENLDLGRFRGPRFDKAVQAYFRDKYQDTPVGVVVAVGSAALELALNVRKELWSEVPVIFTAVDEGALDRLTLPPNVTGTAMHAPLSDAVAVARIVVPRLKRIAVVGDPPERQFIRRQTQAQLDQLASEFELIDLTRLTMTELKQRVASLPADSAIIYIGLTLDAEQRAFTSYEALAALAAVANRPIIVQSETQLGTGAVGGIVASATLMGEEAAKLALRVLDGESPAGIPVTTGNVMKPIFDWRQLQRWNVNEAKLPAGSEVRFREAGLWERYRLQVLLATAAIVLQALLISWLLYERRRRRLAEVTARNAMLKLTQMNRVATAGQLSNSIAHQVNQPLTATVAHAYAALTSLAAEKPNIGEVSESLNEIVSAGQRAGEIVKDVRTMFTNEKQEKAATDINEMILTVLALVRIDLKRHGIPLETHLDERIPAVEANEIQLQQVILNLVMNAIEAMHAVAWRLLRIRTELSRPGVVHVSIEDTGPGIDPSHLSRIFQPLFTTKAGGLGMGLSICRSIIESHDGRIWTSAAAERGSIFHFELPTKDHKAHEADLLTLP